MHKGRDMKKFISLPPSNKWNRLLAGMSLAELLLVVAIIGILATVAVPSFKQQIRESRRGDGITQLLRLKLQQEAYRTKHPQYAKTSELNLPVSEYFDFSAQKISATTYELIAKAKGDQKQDKTCVEMRINQSMKKYPKECF